MTYTCADCGGTFESERTETEALTEARALWAVEEVQQGMALVCDVCWREIVKLELGYEPKAS